MDLDVFTIVAIALAVVIGLLVYYLYNKYRCDAVDEVYDLLKGIFNRYGPRIEHDDPDLYAELKTAIEEMDKAMEDKEISIMEAFMIAKAFLPLTKRLAKFVKEHYE